MIRCTLAASAFLLSLAPLQGDEPRTLMLERGKLLHQEDFKEPLSKKWRVAKGKWEIVDGALRGSELPADMHGAVARLPLAFDSLIIQVDFKVDGARQSTLSINAEKGHIGRVLLNPSGFSVKRDGDKKKKDKGQVLQTVKTPLSPGRWHTLVLELHGKEMVAGLDGKSFAYGADPLLDRKKANFGFTVAGEAASFRNLRVWDSQPRKDWTATRAKTFGK